MGYVDEQGPSMAAARWREKKEQRRNDFTVSDVEDDCTNDQVQGGTLCISPPMDLHAAPVPLSSLPIEWALRIPPGSQRNHTEHRERRLDPHRPADN